jgi:hypothetical protein
MEHNIKRPTRKSGAFWFNLFSTRVIATNEAIQLFYSRYICKKRSDQSFDITALAKGDLNQGIKKKDSVRQ